MTGAAARIAAMEGADQPLRVLYVAGWVHSGSTVLANILGELEGFFAAGEVRHLWRRGLLEDRLCGCQAPFSACPLWQEILTEAFGGVTAIDAERAAAADHSLLLNRRAPQFLLSKHSFGPSSRELREHLARLARLYGAIRSVTGCRVVVDTSKSPLYALLLARLPQVDLRVVHLVRDARGVHHSQRRRPDVLGGVTSLLLYDAWHVFTELRLRRPHRYALVRYEDFADDPVETVRKIVRLTGEPDTELPFVDERRVALQPNHNVEGNSNRFRTGVVELKLDDEWRHGLPVKERVRAVTVTWPLLLRHGYLGRGRTSRSRAASVS